MIGSRNDVNLFVRKFEHPWLKGYKASRKQLQGQKSLMDEQEAKQEKDWEKKGCYYYYYY